MGKESAASSPYIPEGDDTFVGRERELGAIITLLLGRARLVTLAGPGGIGKTRLAIEAIRRYRKPSGAAVRWVRLARLSPSADVDAIEEEIGRSVVDGGVSGPVWAAIAESADTVSGRPLVLVLDNCEHLLPAVSIVVQQLLNQVRTLKILATSRESLRWVHEHRILVPPLSRQEATDLFRHRAEMLDRAVPDDDTVVDICRHLDNSPLCIQLAAARLTRMPVRAVRAELSGDIDGDQRMLWRDERWHGVETRHRRVSDAIDWSYQLCSEKERLLLERMAVFAAGADVDPGAYGAGSVYDRGAELADISAVCSDSPPLRGGQTQLAASEIGDLVDRLASKSLMTVHFTPGSVRYSLVESVRLFAEQRLRERATAGVGEWPTLADRHMQYYRDRVADAAGRWFGSEERQLLDWAQAAWDNILTAIDRSATAPAGPELGLQICAGLLGMRLPFFKGSFQEVRRLAERALTAMHRTERPPGQLEVSATALVAWLAICQGHVNDATNLLNDCVRMCGTHPDRPAIWRDSVQRDTGLPAVVEFAWGNELFVQRDRRAALVLTRAKLKFEQAHDNGVAAVSEMISILAAVLLGHGPQAQHLAQHYYQRTKTSGTSWAKAWAELILGMSLTKQGDTVAALRLENAALQRQLDARERWATLWSVQAHAWTLARMVTDMSDGAHADRGRSAALAADIARLLGGTATLRAKYGVIIEQLGPFYDETVLAARVARKVLGAKAFAAAELQGAQLDPDSGAIYRLALKAPAQPPTLINRATATAAGWSRLTKAEQNVAVLAAAGWTDTAIAARRGCSKRTVNSQMAAVRRKLQLQSRDDLLSRIPLAIRRDVATEAARVPSSK